MMTLYRPRLNLMLKVFLSNYIIQDFCLLSILNNHISIKINYLCALENHIK